MVRGCRLRQPPMVTHPPSSPKTLRVRCTRNASIHRMAESTMVPHRPGARTPILPRDESLLPLTPDVPSTQTTLEYPDSDRRWRCSNNARAPNTKDPTPGETGALQPPDRNTPHPQLQRNNPEKPHFRPSTPPPQVLAVATERTSALENQPRFHPQEADFHGTLKTDPFHPNRARRFLRHFFQMVTGNRSVLRA